MSEEKKGYYAIIPANVRYDKSITPNAKLLYGEITALCNEKGYCWASNNYFADLYEVTPQAISKWINSLSDNGFIKLEKNESIVIELKNKKLDGLGYGRNICEWCGIRTAVLHKHHYPIQKSNGGNAVVNICPNCHHEFHYSEIKISLNISCDELKKLNTEKGIQYKQNGTWLPTANNSSCGYFEIKQQELESGKVIYDRRITQTGREFILSLFEGGKQ